MSNNIKILTLTIISFFIGTSQFIIAGILDKIAFSMNVTVSLAGQLITAFALASAIGSPIITIFASKFSLKKQLLVALYICMLGIAITVISSSFFAQTVARIIMGVGTGVFVAISYAMAAKLALPEHRAKAMANIAIGFSTSIIFGVPLGRFMSSMYEWEVIFWVIGFFTLLGIVVINIFFIDDNNEKQIPITSQLSYIKKPAVLTALSITLAVFIAFSMIATYVTPILISYNLSESKIQFVLLLTGVASLVGSKLSGYLSDRHGSKFTIYISILFTFLSLLLLYLIGSNVFIGVLLILIFTISTWTFGPAQSYNLSKIAPEIAAVIISFNSSIVQLGFAIGAIIGGAIITNSKIENLSILGAIFAIIALYIAKLFFAKSKN